VQIGSVKSSSLQVERVLPGLEAEGKLPAGNGRISSEMVAADEKDCSSQAKDGEFGDFTGELKDFALEIKNTRFEFSVHEATKRVIVRIYDMNTDELISEIPPEKFLDLIANIWKQVGLIIDKKV
jgi:flagellar protein FlaG